MSEGENRESSDQKVRISKWLYNYGSPNPVHREWEIKNSIAYPGREKGNVILTYINEA